MRYFLAAITIAIDEVEQIPHNAFCAAENSEAAEAKIRSLQLSRNEEVVRVDLRDITNSMSDGFIILDITPNLIIHS